jgi:two-component system, chemotaxis family, chemotaxis protein CheY
MKALVVDDSLLARSLLVGALKEVGINDVDQASDGLSGVGLAQKTSYSIILIDWNMPNMLGIDALKSMRKMGIEAPIMMVTGLADPLHIQEAIQAGVNDYMIKPFQKKQAVEKISSLLSIEAPKACC